MKQIQIQIQIQSDEFLHNIIFKIKFKVLKLNLINSQHPFHQIQIWDQHQFT